MTETIRPATANDSDAILSIYAPFITNTSITFETSVPDAGAFREKILRLMECYPYLVCERDGKILGFAYASRHRERAAYCYSVDVSIYIAPDYHRRGIGKSLYSRLFDILRKQGFYTAYAGITMPNINSLALHKSMGFTEVGTYHNVGHKLGKWHDVMWLEKPLREYSENPAEPGGIAQIDSAEMKRLIPLFSGWDETLVWSCIQGHMGRAWANSAANPSAARIICGDFCFFAGDARSPGASTLIADIPPDYNRPWLIMIPRDESWNMVIEDIYQSKFKKTTRYAIKKEPVDFDSTKLHRFMESLPEGYSLAQIDERLYYLVMREDWSRDFCSQFTDYNDYKERGLGFVVLYNGEPVSGASSYTIYDGGIEIEIGTLESHRRRGLAAACAAGLILECGNRGLYPSWDAANKASLSLAEKLGYQFDKEYTAYIVPVCDIALSM